MNNIIELNNMEIGAWKEECYVYVRLSTSHDNYRKDYIIGLLISIIGKYEIISGIAPPGRPDGEHTGTR